MRENYSWDQYQRERRFLDFVARRGIDAHRESVDNAGIELRRRAIELLYSRLNGEKGKKVPTASSPKDQIISTFKNMYDQTRSNTAAYERTLDYLMNCERAGIGGGQVSARIAGVLDVCTPGQLAEIARKYGAEVLGGYADSLQNETKPAVKKPTKLLQLELFSK